MGAQNWIKFYFSDWEGDRKLMSCSLSAQGMWMHMLRVMYESEPPGHFVGEGGKPIKASTFARQIKASPQEARRLIKELERNGVFSRTDENIIFSRRVIKEHERRKRLSDQGREGGEKTWGPKRGSRSELLSIAKSKGTHTEAQWTQIKILCGSRCVFCGIPESEVIGGVLCRDHILPIALGGSDGVENLQPSCRNCNTKKGPKADDRRTEKAIIYAQNQPKTVQKTPSQMPSQVASPRGEPETRYQSLVTNVPKPDSQSSQAVDNSSKKKRQPKLGLDDDIQFARRAILDAVWDRLARDPYSATITKSEWRRRNSLGALDLAKLGITPEQCQEAWDSATERLGSAARTMAVVQDELGRKSAPEKKAVPAAPYHKPWVPNA